MMIISETPSNGTGDAEFFTAIKLICRCEEIPPAEVIVEKAEEYEQFGVRNLNALSKRKRSDLFFSDLYIALWRFDEYAEIKRGGITFTDIENNPAFAMLKLNKGLVIDDFLSRSFDYACSQARKYKTADGRRNYMRRYFESIKEHSSQMCSDNVLRLETLEMLIESKGLEPSARKAKLQKNSPRR